MCNTNKIPDFPKENRIIIDWVSFTTRKHTLYEIIDLLELRDLPWETVRGSHGFMWRQYFNGISLHFNEKLLNYNYYNLSDEEKEELNKSDFVWLEMSGQGCRAFETYGNGNYEILFELARKDPENIHITRLDIAFDDMTGVLDIDTICDETREEHFTSRIKKYQSIYSNGGNAVYFGSKQSNIFIRIYDKAQERGYDSNDLHWIRLEIQLRDVNAMRFVSFLETDLLQNLYKSLLANYLAFRVPTNDSNKRRWPEAKWWTSFINGAVPISVWSKPGIEYNLSACERYVMKQAIGSIKALITIFGKEGFYKAVQEAPNSKNPKYKQLIASVMAQNKLKSQETKVDKLAQLPEANQQLIINELHDIYLEAQQKAKNAN